MGRQRTRATSSTRTRVRRNGTSNASGYVQCNICHGTGVVKRTHRKKK